MILEKKSLRNQTLYKVLWLGKEECNVKWENESAIPRSVLQEFEDNSPVEVEKVSTEKIGQMSHMLSVHSTDSKEERPKNKKRKTDRIVVNSNDGAFSMNEEDLNLKCNTLKEKKTLA